MDFLAYAASNSKASIVSKISGATGLVFGKGENTQKFKLVKLNPLNSLTDTTHWKPEIMEEFIKCTAIGGFQIHTADGASRQGYLRRDRIPQPIIASSSHSDKSGSTSVYSRLKIFTFADAIVPGSLQPTTYENCITLFENTPYEYIRTDSTIPTSSKTLTRYQVINGDYYAGESKFYIGMAGSTASTILLVVPENDYLLSDNFAYKSLIVSIDDWVET